MIDFEHYKSEYVVNRADIGLLILRLGLSFVFIAHGAMNLTTDAEETNAIMTGLGFPSGMATVIGIGEVTSAVMMVAGFLVSYAAWIQIIISAGLVFLVYGKNGFDVHDHGYEYALILLTSAMSVLFLGPGKFVLEKRWGHQASDLRESGVASDESTLAT